MVEICPLDPCRWGNWIALEFKSLSIKIRGIFIATSRTSHFNARHVEELFGSRKVYLEAVEKHGVEKIQKILRAYSKALHHDKKVLSQLVQYPLLRENIVEILSGAHVLIPTTIHFHEWKELIGSTKRSSSHYGRGVRDIQFGFSGRFIPEMLFGKTEIDGQHYTWLQIEKTPLRFDLKSIVHIIDTIKYKIHGKNIGPYGTSSFTDKNPIRVLKGSHSSS